MNFFKLIIISVITCYCYANNINYRYLLKRRVSISDDAYDDVDEQCNKEQEDMNDLGCFEQVTAANYKTTCSNYISEKCQKLYEDPMKFLPSCEKYPAIVELYQPLLIKLANSIFSIECVTDENGDLCPISGAAINHNIDENVLTETCQSKKCTESAIEAYEKFDNEQFAALENLSTSTGSFSYEEVNQKKYIISNLKSTKCKALHKTSTYASESSAIPVKISKSFIISLFFLLFFFN